MMKFTKHKQRGTTVVELLVYLFMFTVLSGGSLTLLFSLDNLFAQYRAKQLVFTSGTTFMERVLTEVREADTVFIPSSIIGSSTAGALALSRGGDTWRIEWETDKAEVWNGSEYGGLLHSDIVVVEGFRVYHYILNDKELVRFSVDMAATVGDVTERTTFTGGAIVRGTYVE